MDFLKKIQNYPEHIKKIILWIAVVVVGLALFAVYVFYVRWKITDFQKKDFGLPAIEVQPLNLEILDSVTQNIIDNLASADKEIEEAEKLELEGN